MTDEPSNGLSALIELLTFLWNVLRLLVALWG